MDFTLKKYTELLDALQASGYRFLTFAEYCELKATDALPARFAILRHDVDLKPNNSFAIARIEKSRDIRASYYFRAVPESWDEMVIEAVAAMGHEIGYHYESLTTCKGDVTKAYMDFCDNLNRLRMLAPVNTICMHGSPRSPYDSKDIWKSYDYNSLDVIGEPYFDTDFSQVFYLTDTGRRWDGFKVSVRDKIPEYQDEWVRKGLVYHKTDDLVNAAQKAQLPSKMMITTHPQRWTNNAWKWCKEAVMQGLKNYVKGFIVKKAHK